MTIDRRTKIPEILDKIEPGWVVVEPVKGELADRCVIQKPSEGREVRVYLPQKWFDDGEAGRIEAGIRWAIEAKTTD